MPRPRWLLGMGVMGIGQLLSAWAVGHMVLSLYEPLQAMSLIFALALAGRCRASRCGPPR